LIDEAVVNMHDPNVTEFKERWHRGEGGEDLEERERVVTDERRKNMTFLEEKNEMRECGGFGEFMKKKQGWDA